MQILEIQGWISIVILFLTLVLVAYGLWVQSGWRMNDDSNQDYSNQNDQSHYKVEFGKGK